MPAFDKAEFLFKATRSEAGLNHGQEWVLDTGIEIDEGPVRCFAHESGQIGLIIPSAKEHFEAFQEDRKSTAIHLIKGKQQTDARTLFHTRLTLRDWHQKTIFYFFCDQILKFLDDTPHATPADIAAQLANWRRFFAGHGATKISQEIEVGLLCELEVLLQLFEDGHPNPIEAWHGPLNDRHDFELSESAVECKASASAEKMHLTIHGTFQLQTLNNKPLHLVFRRYSKHPDGDVSIPLLLDKLQEFSNFNIELFLERSQNLGIDFFNAQARSSFERYFAIDVYQFEVSDDFPHVKLTNDDNRIQNLQYTIDLAGPSAVLGFVPTPTFIKK